MRWISAKERLPAQGQVVLVWHRDAYGDRVWRHGVAEFAVLPEDGPDFPIWHLVGEQISTRDVSHWLPLPEGPKE